MLLDKSGLRKKGTIPPDPTKQIAPLEQAEVTNILTSFGFGTDETNDQKAERIRTELNK